MADTDKRMSEAELLRLKAVIKEVFGSQKACAAELELSPEHLSDILAGRYPVPGILLTLIARRGRSVDRLFDMPPGMVAEEQAGYSAVEFCADRLTTPELFAILQSRVLGDGGE